MANPFTPEQISQILEEFFKVVGTRQYIGARYVPIFGRKGEESIEWDNSAPYEPLTIVLHEGNSYTSKQYVPAGIEITNEKFWALTGNFNAQIEAYRKEVRGILPYDETPTEGSTKGVTSDGIKKAIDTAEQTNATAIANEVTRAKAAEQTNATAIIDEITRATNAEQTNATAIANEVTRATDAEKANADAIQNLTFTNPMYGVCNAGNNTWKYVETYDLSSIGTMGNLPSRSTSYDYSDSSNLFEHNGILYYPQQDHKDIYATRDGETWESGYGLNYPSPLGNDYYQWAPMLFEDKDNNIKLAMSRQYNSEKVTNAIGASTPNFRIDVFNCTVDSTGKINISNEYITVLSNGTHIDPYIVYTEAYGYIMACKNEQTCQIECYTGNELTNMTLKGTLPYVGCEAPKLYVLDNDISLITQAYSLHTGTPQNPGNSVGKFYLTTRISFNPFSYDGMSLISCPSNYRHISFIMNSRILSKYARKHGIIPYSSKVTDKIYNVPIDGTDIYPALLPINISFHVRAGKRTITVHHATLGTGKAGINYIIGITDQKPTLTTENNTYNHVVQDGDVIPLYITPDGSPIFN